MKLYPIQLTINGKVVETNVTANRMLATFLREDLHLTGTKRGCETGVCGACSVIVDGEVVKSCLSLAVQANGSDIRTIEGLAGGDSLHPLQESFMACGGLQCGYCTPGFIMTACAMLERHPKPTSDEVREGLSGNLCRCTGYTQIVEAVLDAAEKLNGN